jgi:hypothetical protein
MRMALIVGARPMFTKGKQFPKVPLGAGSWRIETENRKDSKVRITVFRRIDGDASGAFTVPSVAELGDGHYIFSGPAEVSAEIMEAGKESFINVFAVQMNGAAA